MLKPIMMQQHRRFQEEAKASNKLILSVSNTYRSTNTKPNEKVQRLHIA